MLLQDFGDRNGGGVPVGELHDGDAKLRSQIVDDAPQRVFVAAMRVQQHDLREAVTKHRAHDALDHGRERRIIQGDGAAKTHVMFGQAGPQHRQHDHRLAAGRDLRRGSRRDGLTQHGVDLDRQMRAMLFERGDRQDHDRVLFGSVAEFVGAEFAPFGFGHLVVSPIGPGYRGTKIAWGEERGRFGERSDESYFMP